jgi:hypothetical protein
MNDCHVQVQVAPSKERLSDARNAVCMSEWQDLLLLILPLRKLMWPGTHLLHDAIGMEADRLLAQIQNENLSNPQSSVVALRSVKSTPAEWATRSGVLGSA